MTTQTDPGAVARPWLTAANRPPAIVVSGLTKKYGDIEAVRGIDFAVARGETFGFLGPNGAGKSTTIKILCTLAKPTAGQASVAGHDVVRERDAVRRNIGLVFQDTTLDNYLTGAQNLRFHAELYARAGRGGGAPDAPGARHGRAVGPAGQPGADLLGRHAAAAGDRPRPAARAPGAVPGRAHGRPGPADPLVDLGVHQRAEAARRHHHLPDHALHGRGRALRPDRHHRPREDRGHRHARSGSRPAWARTGCRSRPRTTRRRSASWPRCSASRRPCTRARSRSRSRAAASSCRELFAQLSVPIRSVSVSRPSLDDVFMSYTGKTIRDAEASATDHMRQMVTRVRGRR